MLETTNTMAEETIEVVADNGEKVFKTVDEVIENVGFDWIKAGKTVGGILVVGGVVYGGYKLITKGIPAFKSWKANRKNEAADTESENSDDSIYEEELAVEYEEETEE